MEIEKDSDLKNLVEEIVQEREIELHPGFTIDALVQALEELRQSYLDRLELTGEIRWSGNKARSHMRRKLKDAIRVSMKKASTASKKYVDDIQACAKEFDDSMNEILPKRKKLQDLDWKLYPLKAASDAQALMWAEINYVASKYRLLPGREFSVHLVEHQGRIIEAQREGEIGKGGAATTDPDLDYCIERLLILGINTTREIFHLIDPLHGHLSAKLPTDTDLRALIHAKQSQISWQKPRLVSGEELDRFDGLEKDDNGS